MREIRLTESYPIALILTIRTIFILIILIYNETSHSFL